ncbi:MAG: hypothetical protein QW388_04645 [Thermoplasmatales archaeon]
MREELLAFKATVTAVVARGIDIHQIKHGEEALQEIWEKERARGASRRRPVKVD